MLRLKKWLYYGISPDTVLSQVVLSQINQLGQQDIIKMTYETAKMNATKRIGLDIRVRRFIRYMIKNDTTFVQGVKKGGGGQDEDIEEELANSSEGGQNEDIEKIKEDFQTFDKGDPIHDHQLFLQEMKAAIKTEVANYYESYWSVEDVEPHFATQAHGIRSMQSRTSASLARSSTTPQKRARSSTPEHGGDRSSENSSVEDDALCQPEPAPCVQKRARGTYSTSRGKALHATFVICECWICMLTFRKAGQEEKIKKDRIIAFVDNMINEGGTLAANKWMKAVSQTPMKERGDIIWPYYERYLNFDSTPVTQKFFQKHFFGVVQAARKNPKFANRALLKVVNKLGR